MSEELVYRVALTMINGIGPVQAKTLAETFGNARDIFNASLSQLRRVDGLGEIRAKYIHSYRDFSQAEEEVAFIKKNSITAVFINDENYPRRLLNCYDCPTLLYTRGAMDLNCSRIAAVVGTRKNSPYGKQLTEELIGDLAAHDVTIISGLAHGIDGIAHKTALKCGLQTVGVLAHGLDKLYPHAHIALAREMVETGGGLISEFRKGTAPDRHNFPSRNRIVAGMSDVVIVVETGSKGGSIITAELGNSYNRDVMAFPGRTTDFKSEGCNFLIKTNKAGLLTNAAELLEMMGWTETKAKKETIQKAMFIELTDPERRLLTLIQNKEIISIDELNYHSGLSNSLVAVGLLNLELNNLVASLPGKMYRAI